MILINDNNLDIFHKLLICSYKNKYNFYFNFKKPIVSLKKVKKIILSNLDYINFNNLYFYNLTDFVNILLDKPIYLPKKINLFISEKCLIWCNFCDPNLIKFAKKNYLSINELKKFLSNYIVKDDINFNILWLWDPIFNPDLYHILKYLKSFWANITFFSWWKSILYFSSLSNIDKYIDEYKINLSWSNYKIYNLTHSNKISKKEFARLVGIISKIAHKTILITVLMKDNIFDLKDYYRFVKKYWFKWIEIKKNLKYYRNDILNNEKIFIYVNKIIELISKDRSINIISNIWSWITKYNNFNKSTIISNTILNSIINDFMINVDYNKANSINKCFQFFDSLDLNEDGSISICCLKKVWRVSTILFDWKYYENSIFKNRYLAYKNKTSDLCKKCPMPIDRYKTFLKYYFVKNL